ncbi:family 20 glycosylhydrolase [Pseudoprevotella muciniphila]|nr:family 20 glycosylhydrolase [Pseudoprevotella muciniphila]
MKRLLIFIGILCGCMTAGAKVIHLLPIPQEITTNESASPFQLGRAVSITDTNNTWLLKQVFLDNGCTISNSASANVEVVMMQSLGTFNHNVAEFPDEGYKLSVSENNIQIQATTKVGVIRAAQTLQQLAEGYEGTAAIEAVEITDYPAFKVRGWMHDVGRSFVSVDEIEKEIRLMSRFKINVFHWHFTENQAWRFEVKAYPQLTSSSSMTRFPGLYYTQEECRYIDSIAALYGVTIIPEIDMPGHSEAFTRAMGFNMQTDQGVAVLKTVLTEACEVFKNAPYIHIGGDEVTITYSNFLSTMAQVIHNKGKKVICWNRLVSGAPSSSYCDMTQMWASSGRAVSGIPNIDCRYNYTNHFDVFADLVGMFKSNIYYQQRGTTEAAGFISAPWNDRKTPTQDDIIAQNNVYAVTIATGWRAWRGGGKQYVEKGGTTLPNSGEEYEEFKDFENRFLFHKAHSLSTCPIPYVKQTNVRWRITDPFPNGGSASAKFPPETDQSDILPESFSYQGTTYNSAMATGAGIYLNHTWGNNTVPTFYGNTVPSTNQTAYAWTYVYSPEAQQVGAQIEFYNYGRSETDRAPEAGKWDRYGSDIWLNGTRIAPPVWNNTGVNIGREVDLKNENFPARSPILVNLNQGWNKVLIKLPYNPDGTQRLKKWLFTFVLTDPTGTTAIDGLTYSPEKYPEETAQILAAAVADAKSTRNSIVGVDPGFYPAEAAAALDAVIAEVEATLTQQLGEETRAQQIAQMNAAVEAFVASYKNYQQIIQPKASNRDTIYYYYLRTPQRGNRYATSQGTGNAMVGNTSASDASKWYFMRRSDGTYDIVNNDGSYVSPNSSNNTALTTTSTQPSSGWTLQPTGETGFVIITNGTAEFNQTNNSGLGYNIYNWGNGTNTTDTGCKYRVELVDIVTTGTNYEGVVTIDPSKLYYIHNSYSGWGNRTYLYANNGVVSPGTKVAENRNYLWRLVYDPDSAKVQVVNVGTNQKIYIDNNAADQNLKLGNNEYKWLFIEGDGGVMINTTDRSYSWYSNPTAWANNIITKAHWGYGWIFEPVDNYADTVSTNLAGYFTIPTNGYVGTLSYADSLSLKATYDEYAVACTPAQYANLAANIDDATIKIESGKPYRLLNANYNNHWMALNMANDGSSTGSIINTTDPTGNLSTILIFTDNGDDTWTVTMDGLYLTPVQKMSGKNQGTRETLSANAADAAPIVVETYSPAVFTLCTQTNVDDKGYLHDNNYSQVVGWNGTAGASHWYIVPANSIKIGMNVVNGASYGTLYVPFSVTLNQEDVENHLVNFYKVTQLNTSNIVARRIDNNVIPAATPVILRDVNASTTLTLGVGGEGSPLSDNCLLGTYVNKTITDAANTYVLTSLDGGKTLSFGRCSTAYIPANKAYYIYSGTGTPKFGFDEGDGSITWIDALRLEGINSDSDIIYDLQGRKVNSKRATVGIYIVNGKKVLVK